MNYYPQTKEERNPFTRLLETTPKNTENDKKYREWIEEQKTLNEEADPEFRKTAVDFLKKRRNKWATYSDERKKELIEQTLKSWRIHKPIGGKRKTKKHLKSKRSNKGFRKTKKTMKTKTRKVDKSKKQRKLKRKSN